MTSKNEILSGFDRIAKQRFGENAAAQWSDNDSNVIEIHTARTSAQVDDISRFSTAGNRNCWVTTNANHEVIICREI